MKTMLLTLICFVVLSADKCANVSSRHGTKASVETGPDTTGIKASAETGPGTTGSIVINFTKQIQPILEKRCSPCHFTGGTMYERMPFDASQTILSHKEGILKRIKEPEENALIRKFE